MAKYKIIPSSRTIVQSPISIGHKAEKGVEAIEFDVTAWVETYGSGALTVIMRRWGDVIPYPIALEIDENNKATWTLSDIDTAKAGMAYAQLNYIVGDEVVKKSDIYTFRVMDSLTGEGEPPEAYESWLEHLTHLAAEAMAEVLDIEGIVTDKTLTVDGGIADAKATGDALALKADKSTTYTKTEVDQMIEDVEVETDTTLSVSGKPADAAETGRQIGLLKADLGAQLDKFKENLISYADVKSQYLASGGSVPSTSVNWSAYYFDVVNTVAVFNKISSISSATTQAQVAFYSSATPSNESFISRIDFSNADTASVLNDVPIPNNAVLAIVFNKNSVSDSVTIEGVTKVNFASVHIDVDELKVFQAESTKKTNDIYDCEEAEPYALTSGFLGSNGAVQSAGATTKEVYTSKIAVSVGEKLSLNFKWAETNSQWVAVCTYDEDETFKERIVLLNGNADSFDTVYQIANGSGYTTSYIVLTYRTYGNCDLKVFHKWKELETKIATTALTSHTVRSIAHRGDVVLAPQCTAPSYILARKRGFTIAENDLWLSSDSQFVMWHDTSLFRLGTYLFDINGYYMYTDGTDFYWYDSENSALYTYDGTDYVASSVSVASLTQCKGEDYSVTDLTLAVLKRIDFGAYKGAKFKGTQILTFAEWVLLCKQLGMEIYVDRKLDYTAELLTNAVNTVKRLGMGDKTTWIVNTLYQIGVIRGIIDGARVAYLSNPTESLISSFSDVNTGRGFVFNGNGGNATAESIQLGLDAGFEVECWYVEQASRTEQQQFARMLELMSYGVTGLTLDHYQAGDATAYLLSRY